MTTSGSPRPRRPAPPCTRCGGHCQIQRIGDYLRRSCIMCGLGEEVYRPKGLAQPVILPPQATAPAQQSPQGHGVSGPQESEEQSLAEWLLSSFDAGLELNAIEHQANRPDVNIKLRLQEELEDASGNPPAGLITAGTDGKPGRVSWVDFGGTLLHRPFDGAFPHDYPQHEARSQCAAVLNLLLNQPYLPARA